MALLFKKNRKSHYSFGKNKIKNIGKDEKILTTLTDAI
jgi:hypothetical protein